MGENFCLTPLILLAEGAIAVACGLLTAVVMECDFGVRDPVYIGTVIVLVIGFVSAVFGVWRW